MSPEAKFVDSQNVADLWHKRCAKYALTFVRALVFLPITEEPAA
jgi:hypothetical protein